MKLKPITSIFCSLIFSTIAFASTANDHLDEILAYCDSFDELEKNFEAFARDGLCTHEELALIRPEVKAYCAAKRTLKISLKNEADEAATLAFKGIVSNVKNKLERNTIENLYDIFSSTEEMMEKADIASCNYYIGIYKELVAGYDLVPNHDIGFTELVLTIGTELAYGSEDFINLMEDEDRMKECVDAYYKALFDSVLAIEAYLTQQDLVYQFEQENPPA